MKYKCEECGWEGESERDEEDAREEQNQLFPGYKNEDMAIICDDCFQEMRRRRLF